MLLQALLLLSVPALVLQGVRRVKLLKVIGPVVLCYALGILWGNLGLFPPDSSVAMSVAEVAVPLAIPLLLFSTELASWWRLARTTVLSFGLAMVSVLVTATLGAFLFADQVRDSWKIAGMFVGVYTGGTANLTAIGMALGVEQETFVLVNAADILAGSLYLLFLLTVAQRVLLRFLPPFRGRGEGVTAQVAAAAEEAPPRPTVVQVLLGLLLAAGLVGVSVGLSFLVAGRIVEGVVILAITTLGIAASLYRPIRLLPGTDASGQYLLLVFCFAIGSMSDFQKLTAAPTIMLYLGVVLVGAILLHFFLAALFKIDADTVIITSTAAVFSPAFVGPVAAALGNREVLVPGLTTGVVGYAVGTYLGLALSYVLMP
ncbi:MAG: DUF819 family protein [Bacillota bacterium]